MEVDSRRVTTHKADGNSKGMVIYRMSRDQRVHDNWALLFGLQQAASSSLPFGVVFTLDTSYPSANFRHLKFMVDGLKMVEEELRRYNIPFTMLIDSNPTQALKAFVEKHRVSTIVSDFDPLRHKRRWVEQINQIEGITHHEVDSHNIVPCTFVSNKVEFGAYTLRPKIRKWMDTFLTEFPPVTPLVNTINLGGFSWDQVERAIKVDTTVGAVGWLPSGERQAIVHLQNFIDNRLEGYSEKRNDPTLNWQSDLSPYLHFGQIAAQRVAIAVAQSPCDKANADAFLEELVVRRELSDNYCFYEKNYDSTEGFPSWVKKDMEQHKYDPREHIYDLKTLENGATHDKLWNAAQQELTHRGKMHGYMRMYWAKKILEWTEDMATAQKHAIYLNDKYSLDGRDPNGYVGIAWSIGGVHDRAWFPRPIFGKVRYMSYNGCASKFNISSYIDSQFPR